MTTKSIERQSQSNNPSIPRLNQRPANVALRPLRRKTEKERHMDDNQHKFDRVTQLSTELGDEILRRASSSKEAFHLIRLAAITIEIRVGFGIKAPEFLNRMVAEQNERLVELGIDPLHIYADRFTSGD